MAREIAPNLSYHYWFLGIQGEGLQTEANPLVLVRGSEFTPDKEIESEDDEGHTGTATTKMATYRTSATASPSYTDKTRYKEGWEDAWYLLLGSKDTQTGQIRKEELTTGVYKYTFAVNTAQPQDPAFATLYNGFAKTDHDTFKYENCLLNEFEVSGSNEEAPTYTNTFASNFPKFNLPAIARTLPRSTVFTKPSEVSIYIAPMDDYDDISEIEQYNYPCYMEYSFNVNRNVETEPCASDDFGTSTKVLGNLEAEINITLPWTSATRHLEYVYMGGDENSTEVTDENDEKTVWIVFKSGAIGDTQYNYTTIIKIPKVVLTNADSPQSGTDAKTIELEGTISENGIDSFIECEIITDLENLHIQNPSP